jgi:hypothetical protein
VFNQYQKAEEPTPLKFLVYAALYKFEDKKEGGKDFSFPFEDFRGEITVCIEGKYKKGKYADLKEEIKSAQLRCKMSLLGCSETGEIGQFDLTGSTYEKFISFSKGVDFSVNPVFSISPDTKTVKYGPTKGRETDIFLAQFSISEFEPQKTAAMIEMCEQLFTPYLSQFSPKQEPAPTLEKMPIDDDLPF